MLPGPCSMELTPSRRTGHSFVIFLLSSIFLSHKFSVNWFWNANGISSFLFSTFYMIKARRKMTTSPGSLLESCGRSAKSSSTSIPYINFRWHSSMNSLFTMALYLSLLLTPHQAKCCNKALHWWSSSIYESCDLQHFLFSCVVGLAHKQDIRRKG